MIQPLEQYDLERRRLIEVDSDQRLDKTWVEQADTCEQKATAIFQVIRDLERVHLWECPSRKDLAEDIREAQLAHHLYPVSLRTGKSSKAWVDRRATAHDGKSLVYKLVKDMPKGALLHVHFDAMVPVPILLSWAMNEDLLCISSSQPIRTRLDMTTATTKYRLRIEARPREEYEGLMGQKDLIMPWESHYSAGWVPLSLAAKSFSLGSSDQEPQEAFVSFLEGLMTCSSADHVLHPTNELIWLKFAGTFALCNGLVYHLPIFKKYLRYALEHFIADGIGHVESRLIMTSPMMTDDDGHLNLDHRAWCAIIEEVVSAVNMQNPKACLTFKIIYTNLRALEKHQIAASMEDCIELKKIFPNLIVGYDLVGHEEAGHSLQYFLSEFLWFKQRQENLGLKIPLILHAGETVEQSSPFHPPYGTDYNLVDAISLGSKRLGHGFALVHHPGWMSRVKEAGITVEICPISNDVLRLSSDIDNHPLFTLFNHGIPFALSSDDPSVFSNEGLSPDFFQFLIAQRSHGLMSAKAVIFASLDGSELYGTELERAKEWLSSRWTTFVHALVDDYGPMVGIL